MRIYYFPFDDVKHEYEIFQVFLFVVSIYAIILVSSWLFTKINR